MFVLTALAGALAVFLTSALSGVFGLAGGLILLWLMLLIYPAATALALHGLLQAIACVSRAWLSRAYVDRRILGFMTLGVVTAAAILAVVAYHPDRVTVYIAVGLLPVLVWIPPRWFTLDASRPAQAFFCGWLGGSLNIAVGVSGPTIDIFFIRSRLDRRTVIATKAAFQVVSHTLKFVFYSGSAFALGTADWALLAIVAPFAILGTSAGYWVLSRITDANFYYWMRLVVTAIGAIYLVQGIMLLAGGG